MAEVELLRGGDGDGGRLGSVSVLLGLTAEGERVLVLMGGDYDMLDEILSGGASAGGGAPPAAKSAIGAMKAVAVEAEWECPVCLEERKPPPAAPAVAVVKEMPCGHRFHLGCIEKWLRMHGSCPVCRCRMPVEGEGGSPKGGAATGSGGEVERGSCEL